MRRRLLAVAFAALAPLVALAGCGAKKAPSPAASAAPAVSAPTDDGGADAGDASDDADAEVDADAAPPPPPPPLFSEEPFPEKRSPVPKSAEWEAAPPVSIDRGACACEVRRVREWIRLTGPWDGGLVLLGGSADGLSLRKGEIIFPVRRGERREIELLRNDHSVFIRGVDDVHVPQLAGMLSEQWLAGDERPWIVVR